MITTVAFDADNTLVDTTQAVRAALGDLVAELAEPGLTVELFWQDSAEAFAELKARPVWEQRKESLRRTLSRVGRDGETDQITEHFFELRFGHTRPFPDVLETLQKLRANYRLGYATNGNSQSHRVGLAGQFDFELYAWRTGVPKKPDPRFYAEMARLAQVPAEEMVYVGDEYEMDVVGPAASGMKTVWLNPTGAPVPGPVQPDAVVRNLSELPRILAE